jgi:hypothetical protein
MWGGRCGGRLSDDAQSGARTVAHSNYVQMSGMRRYPRNTGIAFWALLCRLLSGVPYSIFGEMHGGILARSVLPSTVHAYLGAINGLLFQLK